MMLATEVRMTSREIAELTGKEHKNVKRDVEKMLSELYPGDVLNFERIYVDSMNRQQTEFNLDRLHVECLLMGYSATLRMKVLRRLHEL
ncbi:TPA: Rha family transcriptional regulator [Enterobacter kobei]